MVLKSPRTQLSPEHADLPCVSAGLGGGFLFSILSMHTVPPSRDPGTKYDTTLTLTGAGPGADLHFTLELDANVGMLNVCFFWGQSNVPCDNVPFYNKRVDTLQPGSFPS